MKFLHDIAESIKNMFKSDSTCEHVSKSEETKRLIEKNIAEKDRCLFKHFCHEDLRKLLALREGHELKEQSIEDILDHMDRALTKRSVTVNEQEFCADTIEKMFRASSDRNKFFERIEAHIGSEHFIQDLVKHNAALAKIVNDLK